MDKTLIPQRLMETFLVELDERLHAMSQDLLGLEASQAATPERERHLRSLMRNAHNLKGAARAVETKVVEEACHHLEEIMEEVKRTPALLEQHLVQLLFGVLDGLAEASKLLRKQEPLEGSLLAGLSLEMALFIESTIRPSNSTEPVPKAADQHSRPAAADGAQAPQEAGLADVSRTHGKSKGVPSALLGAGRDALGVAEGASESLAGPAQEPLSVRIDTEKLDSLLTRSGELLAARQRLRMTADRLADLTEAIDALCAEWRRASKEPGGPEPVPVATWQPSPRLKELQARTPERLQGLQAEMNRIRLAFREEWRVLDHAGAALDHQVSRIRMLPFAHACVGFDRMVRDLVRSSGKEVELRVEGGDVELDRSILDGLKDPLRHLIRNAVDHGIESTDERRRAKKPSRGTIVASASLRGGQVEVMVSDDGRGLAADAIRRRAEKMHLPSPSDDRQLIDAIFLPGFSTAADAVSLVSGRGIGLDVVRSQIKALHGEVDVSFEAGKGTSFRLIVPLTLTLLRVLLVKVSEQTFAISNNYVHKLLRLRQNEVIWIGDRPMIHVEGRPVLLETLAQALGLPQPPIQGWPGKRPVMVLKSEQRLAAFLVDELLAEQEVMVKSLGARIQRLGNIAGAVILPDGTVALTLHVAELLHHRSLLAGKGTASLIQHSGADGGQPRRRRRILVVDDSVTTRSLEKSILEAAGFEVELTSDGTQGWERIQSGKIDLVLSDVDMPLLNGFQLTQLIRKSEQFRKLPVILITSNDDELSRERGMAAGASAYMTKGNFDQNLLMNLIEQLI